MKKTRTRVLLQWQIEQAMKLTRSNRGAAEYLRVSYNLYKKYAKIYKNKEGVSLFQAHFNQAGSGISKSRASKNRFLLDDILLGRYPQYSTERLLRRMVVSGYIEEKCNHCGYCQKRPTDLKTPLLLNHINGDITDHKRSNLEILCYNCYFVLVGDIKMREFKTTIYDRPEEQQTPVDDILQDPERLQAVSTIDLLTDQEKMDLIRKLNEI